MSLEAPLRVLIVDDMAIDREGLAEFLENEGFVVDQAGTGAEMLRKIEQNNGQYNVILLDESLPDAQGTDLIRDIKQQYPGIQLIMFTGHDIESWAGQLELGVFSFKIKPVHPREILLDIRSISEARLSQRAEALHRFLVECRSIATELEALAEKTLDFLAEIVPYDKATVQLFQDDDQLRRLVTYRGFGEHEIDHHLLRPVSEDSLVSKVIQGKEPFVLSDTNALADWVITPHTENVGSWIGIPLLLNDKSIGLITLDHTTPHQFINADVELLNLLAKDAAIFINNAAIQEDIQRRLSEFEFFNEILQSISGKHKVESLLKTIEYNIILYLENCDQIAFFLPEQENDETVLKVVVHDGLDPDLAPKLRFREGEGIAGTVFQTGQSRLVLDTTNDPDFVILNEGDIQARSMLVSPIKAHQRTIGVICVDYHSYGAFTTDDQRWLDALAEQAGTAIEHRRILDDLKANEALIIGAHTVKDVLAEIIKGSIKLVHAHSGAIYLKDPDTDSWLGVPYPAEFDPPAIREDGFTRHIFETKQTLVINNTDYPAIAGKPDLRVNPELLAYNVRSMVGIPVQTANEIIGVFYINSTELHDYTESEQAILEALAGQAAIAIQQADLKDAQIRTLGEISDNILATSTQESPTNLEAILKLVTDLMRGAILGQIRLVDETTQELYVVECYKNPHVKINRQNERIPIGKGITGWVAEHGQSQIVPDVQRDERYIPYIEGSRSELAVPMFKGEKVIGILNIEHPRVNAFNKDDQRLAEAIASLMVVAMENSNLILTKIRRLAELEGVMQVHEILAAALSAPDLLNEVLDKIIRVTNATCGTIHMVDEGQQTLVLAVARDVPDAAVGDLQEVTRNYVGSAVRKREIRNLGNVEENDQAEPYQAYCSTTKSALIVPMVADETLIGVMIVESDKQNAFSSHAERLAKGLANQAALAIIHDYKLEQARADEEVAVRSIRRANWQDLIRQKAFSMGIYLAALRKLWNEDKSDLVKYTAYDAFDNLAHITEQLHKIEDIITKDEEMATVGKLREITDRPTFPKNIDVFFDLDCDEKIKLNISASQFEFAIEELIDNAIDAMQRKYTANRRNELHISAHIAFGMIEITIHDSGPGIQPPVRPYFLRSSMSDLGRGILIARTIIVKHHGNLILVRSDASHGTELLVKLPVLNA